MKKFITAFVALLIASGFVYGRTLWQLNDAAGNVAIEVTTDDAGTSVISNVDTIASLTLASPSTTGDITLSNDETIDNATDGEVRATFNDDATTLGTLSLESDNANTNVADADKFVIDFTANNDSSEKIAYASINAVLSDVTTNTEDGAIQFNVQEAGTGLVTRATVNSSGVVVSGAVIANGAVSGSSLVASNGVSGVYTAGAFTITFANGVLTSVSP